MNYNTQAKSIFFIICTISGINAFTNYATNSLCLKYKHFYTKLYNSRENEIRRKIAQYKREGRINKDANDNAVNTDAEKKSQNSYDEKIRTKLGGAKNLRAASKMMGRSITGLGSEVENNKIERDKTEKSQYKELENITHEEEEEELNDEKELLDLVSRKLNEKKEIETVAIPSQKNITSATKETIETANKTKFKGETYRPSRGSWGYFERPKDISKAFGGGKRVGAGVQVDEESRLKSEEETKRRLQQYRQKVGIDVASEKENADVIHEALELATKANQRGMYTTTVSCLEKVTPYCSTNSQLGGKVFLELAMAYEAVGRSAEAITVYSALSKSPIETIKMNAQKLLFGLEAMNFMRDEVKSAEFSRNKIRNNFIDTTGLKNIADNFDDVYNTAYIDLEKGGGYYKRLTESLVRSAREARIILMKAHDSEDISRLKVVQALRSMSRYYDDALIEEKYKKAEKEEPVAMINGVPLRPTKLKKQKPEIDVKQLDKFILASSEQMLSNLDGEWKLQLMADKKGDGVKYFNSTLSWQKFDSASGNYLFYGPSMSTKGGFSFQNRVLFRNNSPRINNSWLSFLGKKDDMEYLLQPIQIILVDSELCITRLFFDDQRKIDKTQNQKDYFAVWRKVDSGTFSQK